MTAAPARARVIARSTAIACCLSLGTATTAPAAAPTASPPAASTASPPAASAPASERDFAYERGVQAEAAGDHAAAAAAYERAYRLTDASESGPRLLFLRTSVAAYLRAEDGAATTRLQLCHAQALLRDYLAGTRDVSADEHTSLGRVDQRLSQLPGPDCAALLEPTPVEPTTTPPPQPRPGTQPQPQTRPQPQPAPEPSQPRPAPDRRTPRTRALLGVGAVSLGLGVAAFAVMGAGITTSQRAQARGTTRCRELPTACVSNENIVREILADGEYGNRLTRVGAAVGGVAVLAGIALIVVGERLHRRSRLALAPRLAPGELGLGLAGSF